jgi:hypothetical protein
MARCPAITRSGSPCKGIVSEGAAYCPAHDPEQAERRKRTAPNYALHYGLSCPVPIRGPRMQQRVS